MSKVCDFYQVSDMKTPYFGVIPNGLYEGKSIFVVLRTNDDFQEFTINLETGNDIAFHFNPRFKEGKIVTNFYLNDQWGDEEIEGEFPFVQGRKFGIQILTSNEGYTVFVKGKQICYFKHQVPVIEVEAIGVKGDIQIEDIVFTN